LNRWLTTLFLGGRDFFDSIVCHGHWFDLRSPSRAGVEGARGTDAGLARGSGHGQVAPDRAALDGFSIDLLLVSCGRGGRDMSIKQKQPVRNDKTVVRHFIFIEAPIEIVGPEAMAWGVASWWPAESLLRFTKMSAGDLAVGTVYKQEIKMKRLSTSWQVEITKFEPNILVERTFKGGLIKGCEIVRIGERSNGTRVDYERDYEIVGPLNKILWPVFYQKQYDANIELALRKLKDYAVKKYQGLEDSSENKTEGA
jgi:hypothetical protein